MQHQILKNMNTQQMNSQVFTARTNQQSFLQAASGVEMVYEAVEAVALKGLLQRTHEHQLRTAKESSEENGLGWGIILWIIRKVCLAV
jgi:hypothetical protein